VRPADVLRKMRAARGRALRAGVSVLVPLLAGWAAGRLGLGVVASVGAFAGYAAWDDPYRRRARVVAGVGVGLTLAIALGSWTAGSDVLAALVGGVMVAAAAFVATAFELPPPRAYFVALAYLLATGMPPSPVGDRVLWAAGGAAFAWLVAMAGALTWPTRPEELAVGRAYDAVAGLLDAVGTPDAAQREHDAVLAVRSAHVAVRYSGGAVRPESPLRDRAVTAEALLEAAMAHELLGEQPLPGWSAAVRDLRAGRTPDVPDVSGADPGSPAGRLDQTVRDATTAKARSVPWAPRHIARESLRAAWAPSSLAPIAAARIGIAVAAGIAIGRLVGLEHGYWVGLTAAAVLQATNVALVRRRALQRAVGTGVGVLIAAGILALDPGTAAIIAAITVLQAVTELLVGVHYGLAVAFLTSLPLLLIHLAGATASGAALAGDRLLDTVIGCAVGLLAVTLLWPAAARNRLPAAQATAVDRIGDVLATSYSPGAAPGPALHRVRRELRTALVNMQAVQRDALGDARQSDPHADRRWPITVAVERLAYLALAARIGRVVLREERLTELGAALSRLAGDLRTGRAADDASVPSLQGLPYTEAQIARLRDTLNELQR
jgi:uncharacterized membrane protein YccC